jgi:parallel beta-helix repeat protein
MQFGRGKRGVAVLFSLLMVASVFAVAAVPVGAASADDPAPAATSNALLATSDVLGGTQTTGALLVNVTDGNVRVFRWTGSAWSGQYFPGGVGASRTSESSDTALYVDGALYDLPGGGTADSTGTDLTLVGQTLVGSTVTSEFRTPEDVVIVQRITYVDGEQRFDLEWDVTNDGSGSVSDLRLFNLKDTYLAGGDNGEGFWDANTNTVGVTKIVGGEQQRLAMRGITDPFAYQSNFYSSVRSSVSSGGLGNVVDSNNHDNGYGLEWRRGSLAAGDTWTVQARESFSLSPIIVTGPGTVTLSGDTVDLDFDVENFGSSSTTVGFTTAGPSGWTVTTPSDETIAAGGSTTVTVTADPPSGTATGFYDVELTATGSGGSSDTGVAQVEVTSSAIPVAQCRVIDSPGTYELAGDITNATVDVCIDIRSDDVTLNGNGFAVDGVDDDRGSVGVLVNGSAATTTSGVVVDGVTATNWWYGIQANGASTVRNNTLTDDFANGVYASGNDVRVEDNLLVGNFEAMRSSGRGNVILDNEFRDNRNALNVFSASDNLVRDNLVVNHSGSGITVSGNTANNTLEGNDIREIDGPGVRLYQNEGPTQVIGNTITDSDVGISVEGASNVLVRDTNVAGNGEAFRTGPSSGDSSIGNVVERLEIDASTVVSFEGRHVILAAVSGPPADPAGTANVGQYVNATARASGPSYLDLTFEYTAGALSGLDENTLAVWNYDAGTSTWAQVPGSTVDTAANRVSANVTSFSVFAPLVTTQPTAAPTISNYEVDNPSQQDLVVRFDADETLDGIEVAITDDATGTQVATLTEANFSVSGSTYSATTDVGADGTFTATLLTAADGDGNDGANAEAGTVTIDTRAPDLRNFRGSADGRTLEFGFDSSKPLDEIEVVVRDPDGNVVGRLDEGDIDSDGDGYGGSIDVPSDGRYRVTVERATDQDGRDGAAGRTIAVLVDTVAPTISDFTLTNPSGQLLRVALTSDEPLREIVVNVRDTDSDGVYGLLISLFRADGDTYTATVDVGRSGDFVARLEEAIDAGGNDGSAGETDTETIPESVTPPADTTPPGVVEFDATSPEDTTVAVALLPDEPVGGIVVELSDSNGNVVATLTEADFALEAGRFLATADVGSGGSYTARLVEMTDLAGNVGPTAPVTATVTVVDPLAEYAGADGVVDTDELRRAISDFVTGEIDADLFRAIVRAWASGG